MNEHATPSTARRFQLVRHQDETGVSGTGTVAEGVQWADGTVVLRWLGPYASTVIWPSLDHAMTVHGHDGKTRAVWLDPADLPLAVDHGDLRGRMADAILAATYPPDEWPDGPPGEGEMDTAREQADAALAVIDRDPVLEIRPYCPTQDAYDAACRALEKHRKRADDAERLLEERTAELGQLRARLDEATGNADAYGQKMLTAQAAIARVRAAIATKTWPSAMVRAEAIRAALDGGE